MTKRDNATGDEAPDTDPNVIADAPQPIADETPSPMTKSELISAMDAHEAEGLRLDKIMEDLGLTPKDVKTIRKAEKAAAAARRTLDALMGIDPAAAEKAQSA